MGLGSFGMGFVGGLAKSVDESVKKGQKETSEYTKKVAEYHALRQKSYEEDKRKERKAMKDALKTMKGAVGGDLNLAAKYVQAAGTPAAAMAQAARINANVQAGTMTLADIAKIGSGVQGQGLTSTDQGTDWLMKDYAPMAESQYPSAAPKTLVGGMTNLFGGDHEAGVQADIKKRVDAFAGPTSEGTLPEGLDMGKAVALPEDILAKEAYAKLVADRKLVEAKTANKIAESGPTTFAEKEIILANNLKAARDSKDPDAIKDALAAQKAYTDIRANVNTAIEKAKADVEIAKKAGMEANALSVSLARHDTERTALMLSLKGETGRDAAEIKSKIAEVEVKILNTTELMKREAKSKDTSDPSDRSPHAKTSAASKVNKTLQDVLSLNDAIELDINGQIKRKIGGNEADYISGILHAQDATAATAVKNKWADDPEMTQEYNAFKNKLKALKTQYKEGKKQEYLNTKTDAAGVKKVPKGVHLYEPGVTELKGVAKRGDVILVKKQDGQLKAEIYLGSN